jgi:phosphate starvation-inducible PhoH-like protein
VDLPPDRVSGLIEVRDILRHVEGIRFVYFDERDVVRHKLVQDIIKAYDQHESASSPSPQAAQAGRRQGSPSRPTSSLSSPPKGSWGQPH